MKNKYGYFIDINLYVTEFYHSWNRNSCLSQINDIVGLFFRLPHRNLNYKENNSQWCCPLSIFTEINNLRKTVVFFGQMSLWLYSSVIEHQA